MTQDSGSPHALPWGMSSPSRSTVPGAAPALAPALLLLAVHQGPHFLRKGPTSLVVGAGSLLDDRWAQDSGRAPAARHRALADGPAWRDRVLADLLVDTARSRLAAATDHLTETGICTAPGAGGRLPAWAGGRVRILDTSALHEAASRASAAMRPRQVLGEADAALALLAWTAGMSRALVPKPRPRGYADTVVVRLDELLEDSGATVTEVVLALRRLLQPRSVSDPWGIGVGGNGGM